MNRFRRTCILSAWACSVPCLAAPTPPPTAATQDLLDDPANTGLKAMIDGDELVALYGVPFATDSDPQTTTYDFVDNWLFDPVDGNKDALGVDEVVLVFDKQVDTGDGKFSVFIYTQEIENLPVFGSRVTIPVLLGATEKIGYIGIRLFPNPEPPLPADVLTNPDDVDDVVIGSTEYGHLTDFSTPVMVIYQDDDEQLHRAWQIRGWDDDEVYLFFIDTNTSDIVGVYDVLFDFDVSGTVSGFATPGTTGDYPPDADRPNGGDPGGNPDSYPIVMNLGGIRVSAVNAQGQEVQYTHTDSQGDYSFTGLTEPVVIKTNLIGQIVDVQNTLPRGRGVDLYVCSDPSCSNADCTSDNCLNFINDTQGDVDLVFNPAQDPPPAPPTEQNWPDTLDTSQVNAFRTIIKSHEWISAFEPGFAQSSLGGQMLTKVNQGDDSTVFGCNAFFAWADPLQFWFFIPTGWAAGYCNNSAFSTIVSHEYGHYVQLQHIGIDVRYWTTLTFAEGFADTFSSLTHNTDCLFEDWRFQRTCTRQVDAVFDNDNYLSFTNCAPPDGCNVQLHDARCRVPGPWAIYSYHCQGLALAGAFWDLRERLLDSNPPPGKDADWKTEQLFSNFFMATASGILDQRVLIEVLAADDDDGDLSSTPNYQAIYDSFVTDHGWAPDTVGPLNVQWDGPAGSPTDQGPNPDYVVDYRLTPPRITLITTEKGGDRVQKWRIGRIHYGCDGDQSACTTDVDCVGHGGNEKCIAEPFDIGQVDTNWGDSYDVIVQVGSNADATLECRNVDFVDVDAQSATNWSSIELYLEDSLREHAECDAYGVNGGRIAGTIPGSAKSITAQGVGKAATDPATLDIAGVLNGATLRSIPASSVLNVGGIDDVLGISGDLDGTLDVAGDLDGTVNVSGSIGSTGLIRVRGALNGDLHISGALYGDIIIDGNINGTVTIEGVFNGDICAKNLTPGMSFAPANFSIAAFGSGASICGWPGECTTDADCADGNVCTGEACDGMWCDYTDNGACSVSPPTLPRPPHNARSRSPYSATIAPKNRYVSFSPTTNDVVAYEIELTALQLTSCSDSGEPCRPDRLECDGDRSACATDADCVGHGGNEKCIASDCGQCNTGGAPCMIDANCPGTETCEITDPAQTCVNDQAGSVGTTWWVGTPDANGVARVVPYTERERGASWPTIVHVGDCEIVPGATYRIRATDDTNNSSWLYVDTTPKPGANYWADAVGSAYQGIVWQVPDGAVNFTDIQAQVFGFAQVGAFSHVTWLDMLGERDVEGTPPDSVVTMDDIQFALGAFQGFPYPLMQPGNCPASPSQVSPGGTPIQLSVVPRSEIIEAGQDVIVDVFMDSAASLGAYQVKLAVTGGTSGDLVLTNITVDTTDDDYVFKNESPTTGIHPDGERVGGTLALGDGVSVSTVGYLATYTYQATGGASGVFTISVVEDDTETFLNDASGTRLAIQGGAAAVVGYGIDCYNDGHCDDSNDCTTDTCTSNECGYTNVASGTGCDDGLWCTKKGSTCDGNGNCTGGTPRCLPGEICDEQAQLCIGQ